MNAPDTSGTPGAAFDTAAESYDLFESLPAVPRLRRITRGLFLEAFPSGASLLELSCGTGSDALAMAAAGRRVLATDASPAMLREAERKWERAGRPAGVSFRELPFEHLSALGTARFDGAYSNMGGLNCLADLSPVFSSLHTLLNSGAHAVVVVMPDFSLWESAGFLLRGRIGRAFRRRNPSGVDARVGGGSVRTYYHSPASLAASAPGFRLVRLLGLNVFSPPPSSVRAAALGPLRGLLERLDDLAGTVPAVARLGDHYAAVLRRIP
jgi:SAM-dependent methyltransferase